MKRYFEWMKYLNWNPEKNEVLEKNRGLSFEEIAYFIVSGQILGIEENPKYPKQRMYILEIENYAVVVPYIETEHEIFLKTAFPSRKDTKRYGLEEKMNRFSKHAFQALDEEEKKIMKSIEQDEWKPVEDSEREKENAIQAARNTLKKDKRINLRLSQRDYHQIQMKAIEEGMPYQTLIASIVHKYLSGSLIPKTLKMNEHRTSR